MQKSAPVKLARLLLHITIGCCFDSHPRIDSVLQRSGFRYGLLENAIGIDRKKPRYRYSIVLRLFAGIIIGTIFTLFVVPVLYVCISTPKVQRGVRHSIANDPYRRVVGVAER